MKFPEYCVERLQYFLISQNAELTLKSGWVRPEPWTATISGGSAALTERAAVPPAAYTENKGWTNARIHPAKDR